MRAVIAEGPGGPDVLVAKIVAPPEPAADEIRIAVEACGVCFHDVVVRNGTFRRGVAFPLILGHEVCGRVERVGGAVRHLRVGDRVATTIHSRVCGGCRRCRTGRETSCPERVFLGDAGLNGGYAELVCVGANNAVLVPEGVIPEEAAIAACTVGTELNAIREVGRVRPGERVLLTGAGGGLGLHGVQLARLAGAFVIALTTSPGKAARIREAGADEVVVTAPGADFSAEVRRITGGEGVDVVIDNVGSPVFGAARRSVADDGRMVLVGQLTGDFVRVNLAQLFLRNVSILSAKGVSRAQLEDALRLIASRRIRPMVSERLALHQAGQAHAEVEAGRSLGRFVLTPSS